MTDIKVINEEKSGASSSSSSSEDEQNSFPTNIIKTQNFNISARMMELTVINEKSESCEIDQSPKIQSPKVQTPELQSLKDLAPDLQSAKIMSEASELSLKIPDIEPPIKPHNDINDDFEKTLQDLEK